MVREGLRLLLERQPDITVVGEATDGMMAVKLVHSLAPHIVIMDIAMPDMNGIEATRQIVAEGAGTRVIALSVHGDKRYVAEMLKAGASGYLLKANAFDLLIQAIAAVNQGLVYLCPEVAGVVVEGYLESTPEGSSAFTLLTPRERMILQLLTEGHSVKDIALRLCISPKTVDVHKQKIMDKLQVQSVAELVRYAIREGIVPLDA
jgi:DNA-binding NarL/FixJ family response regulator